MAIGQVTRLMSLRFFSSKTDWKKLRPIILKRIRNRAGDYPIKNMIPVAENVLQARQILRDGISTLLKFVPIKACKFCPEVFIGSIGHVMKTCHNFGCNITSCEHKWIDGKFNDIIVPVEAFHLQTMFQKIIKHDHRFDYDRVPAVIELCYQAGAEISDEILYDGNSIPCSSINVKPEEISQIAQDTLNAWERLRLGVTKLLLVYPAKVCQHCSEVHIGPSGHKARLCGLFKDEKWRGFHMWKKAEVDDLVPLKVVWHRRPQDPPTLSDNDRGFYGHAPAVVEICLQAGARVSKKYHCMMKMLGTVFVYPADKDSVLLVDKDAYSNCNTSSYIMKYSDGSTVFTFNRSGPFFFISGEDQNCWRKQSLVVVVMANHHNRISVSNQSSIAPSPSPLTESISSPPLPWGLLEVPAAAPTSISPPPLPPSNTVVSPPPSSSSTDLPPPLLGSSMVGPPQAPPQASPQAPPPTGVGEGSTSAPPPPNNGAAMKETCFLTAFTGILFFVL